MITFLLTVSGPRVPVDFLEVTNTPSVQLDNSRGSRKLWCARRCSSVYNSHYYVRRSLLKSLLRAFRFAQSWKQTGNVVGKHALSGLGTDMVVSLPMMLHLLTSLTFVLQEPWGLSSSSWSSLVSTEGVEAEVVPFNFFSKLSNIVSNSSNRLSK